MTPLPKMTPIGQRLLAMIATDGPINTDALADRLGIGRQAAINAIRALQGLRLIHHTHWLLAPPRADRSGILSRRRPAVWAIGPMPAHIPRQPARRVGRPEMGFTLSAGVTAEDLEWMRHWRHHAQQRQHAARVNI